MHPYVVVDAFTRIPLRGNPVAVFFESAGIPAERMQRIAAEMNLSEVTFVLPSERGGDARVRIFTPVNELPFAGHPLLGTAVALGPYTTGDRLLLETAMGTITLELERAGGREDGRVTAARMWQPVPTWEPFDRAGELLDALGVEKSALPVEIYRNGPRHVLVGVENVAALAALAPDHHRLAAFDDLAVNCFAGFGTHWRNRMFSPAYGVREDPATGSAAGALAVHLTRHGLVAYGERIEILQGVEMGRRSRMLARAEGSGDRIMAVEVGGEGVTVAHGTLHV